MSSLSSPALTFVAKTRAHFVLAMLRITPRNREMPSAQSTVYHGYAAKPHTLIHGAPWYLTQVVLTAPLIEINKSDNRIEPV